MEAMRRRCREMRGSNAWTPTGQWAEQPGRAHSCATEAFGCPPTQRRIIPLDVGLLGFGRLCVIHPYVPSALISNRAEQSPLEPELRPAPALRAPRVGEGGGHQPLLADRWRPLQRSKGLQSSVGRSHRESGSADLWPLSSRDHQQLLRFCPSSVKMSDPFR